MMWDCKIRFILITILHTCFIASDGVHNYRSIYNLFVLERKKTDNLCVCFMVISPSDSH